MFHGIYDQLEDEFKEKLESRKASQNHGELNFKVDTIDSVAKLLTTLRDLRLSGVGRDLGSIYALSPSIIHVTTPAIKILPTA